MKHKKYRVIGNPLRKFKNPEERRWYIGHIIPQSELPYDHLEHPNFGKTWALENLHPIEITDETDPSELMMPNETMENYIQRQSLITIAISITKQVSEQLENYGLIEDEWYMEQVSDAVIKNTPKTKKDAENLVADMVKMVKDKLD